ncbi:hypothetical protein LTR04_002393 [Oleoguttula sp. CCFEE 6159]|nr:hypothetical protein LTR04_002393 [Oleoguttula sp. CCFEE 6159]
MFAAAAVARPTYTACRCCSLGLTRAASRVTAGERGVARARTGAKRLLPLRGRCFSSSERQREERVRDGQRGAVQEDGEGAGALADGEAVKGEAKGPVEGLREEVSRRVAAEGSAEFVEVDDGAHPSSPREIEATARRARQTFGETLPADFLSAEEYLVYERLYGAPLATTRPEDMELLQDFEDDGLMDEEDVGSTGVLREGPNGELEEVEFDEEALEDDVAVLEEADEDVLGLNGQDGEFDLQDQEEEMDNITQPRRKKWAAGSSSATQHDAQQHDGEDDLEWPADPAELAETDELDNLEDVEDAEAYVDGDSLRSHPLTIAGRFATSPSTLQLPKDTFVEPLSVLLAPLSNKHLSESTHRAFGGLGLPYSPATPRISRTMQQKPIALDAYQNRMSEIDGDAYVAAVMPAVYASVTSTLTEVRKRLGSQWLAGLMSKEGGPRILDAGGAGAGIHAAREVIRAEWERTHENTTTNTGLATATGTIGGAPAQAPLGKATVLTASDALRHRASQTLENTTFIPRLPDYVHASDQHAQERGKYDIIVAPHTLWPLNEDYLRKAHVQNLWSLLSTSGGVLVLLEKGVPRGFELVAGARQLLLDRHVASPGSTSFAEDMSAPGPGSVDGRARKETGMIVAPCTNHAGCPMYTVPGISKGRKDFCHFQQRFIRPPFLQRVLGAKGRNHEDVEFSYVAVMRGRDLRQKEGEEGVGEGVVQGAEATDTAFAGYEDQFPNFAPSEAAETSTPNVNAGQLGPAANTIDPLAFPRLLLPPLKRRGHVILDLCTPAGQLERWTVPKSFSKQAFRDARKAQWGDLWALGAKTRAARNVRLGRGKEELGGVHTTKKPGNGAKGRADGGPGSGRRRTGKAVFEVPVDPRTGSVLDEEIKLVKGKGLRQEAKGPKSKAARREAARDRKKGRRAGEVVDA